jgi:hypothetical protein
MKVAGGAIEPGRRRCEKLLRTHGVAYV